MKKLIRIPLQFFGAPDADDDFGDEFLDDDYDDVPEYYGSDNDDPDEEDPDDEDSDGDGQSEPDEDKPDDASADDGKGDSADDHKSDPADDEKKALISELRALGFSGDDLKALAADMKKKREDGEARAAAAERKAVNSEGKGHLRSSNPGRAASGEGAAGFSERQVESFAATLGCTKEHARKVLSSQMRKMA